ncbi:MAG: S1C family serine protease [bacterium]
MSQSNNLLEQVNGELADVVSTARPSLVQIQDGRRGTGAGTVLHADGLIVSNAHVVRNSTLEVITWDGQRARGRLLARDRQRDLAAIAVDLSGLPALPLSDSHPRAGQWVVALGHPWGVRGAATAGMIIAVGQPAEPVPYAGPLLQVGLHLRPGHSGGPMLDARGRLVGINTMINGPHVGLAIPLQTVKRFLKEALGSDARRRRHGGHRRAPLQVA